MSETREMIALLGRVASALDTRNPALEPAALAGLHHDVVEALATLLEWRERPVQLRPPEVVASHLAAIIKTWDAPHYGDQRQRMYDAIEAARPYAVTLPTGR